MSEDPKEVHPEDSGPAGLGIEEMPITKFSQTSSGIFPSVIPGQRMHRVVAIMLIAVPMLPIPEDSSESVQKSVLCPTENVFAVSGA